MANNPNANANLTKPFLPGQSGNPGGLTKDLRAQIDANTAMAVRVRQAQLESLIAQIDAGETPTISAELNGFIKAAEDRGLGQPMQPTEMDLRSAPQVITLAGRAKSD